MNNELLKKAREAKSPEELLKLAHENGMKDLTEEDAKLYFDRLNTSGELSDEELDVSAGGCFDDPHTKGLKKVSKTDRCRHGWRCKKCGNHMEGCRCITDSTGSVPVMANDFWFICENCMYATCIESRWYCTNKDQTK